MSKDKFNNEETSKDKKGDLCTHMNIRFQVPQFFTFMDTGDQFYSVSSAPFSDMIIFLSPTSLGYVYFLGDIVARDQFSLVCHCKELHLLNQVLLKC